LLKRSRTRIAGFWGQGKQKESRPCITSGLAKASGVLNEVCIAASTPGIFALVTGVFGKTA